MSSGVPVPAARARPPRPPLLPPRAFENVANSSRLATSRVFVDSTFRPMSVLNDRVGNALNETRMDHSPVLPLDSFGNVMMFLFNIALATAIIFLNLSVFISIMVNKCLRSENQFMYMLSTCFSDICSGVSYYYVGVLDVRDSYDSPKRTFYIAPTFLGLSYMAILAAQADRYHAVSAPFKYSQRMTRNRTLLVILAYWIYAFVIVGVNNLVTVGVAKRVTGIGTFVGNIFTVVIMIGLNIRLFLIAKYHLERDPPSVERENKRSSVYLIILVAVFFLGAWLPIFIHIILCNFVGTTCYTFKNEGTDPLRILPRINAVLTPVLYVRGCTPLRETLFGKVWKKCSTKRRVIPVAGRPGQGLHGRLVTVLFKW
ncbi:adenosine receptor A2a-like [Anguilla anguilla]|uniref:adenosine receptor A2a-like n=1 Tax=Anguilla anguilla TaxID=7936 RepID=UPI0015A7E073|nr:adenosine receptor A2a-like [Anguilla anguilla]